MSPGSFSVLPLALSLVVAGVYVVYAIWRRQPPQLGPAITMLFSVGGVFAGVRLICFCFTNAFVSLTQIGSPDDWMTISAEDRLVFIVGGFALVWTSLQSVLQGFKEVRCPTQ